MPKKILIILILSLFFAVDFCRAEETEDINSSKICTATSKDGLNWQHDAAICLDRASAPCAIVAGGKIYLYFLDHQQKFLLKDTAACAISSDGKNFERQNLIIAGMPSYQAFDPSVIMDGNGKFRLYYLAEDPVFKREDKRQIHLAESYDGVFFEEKGVAFVGPYLRNPEVFFFNGEWYIYVRNEQKNNVIVGVSDEGYKFKYLANLAFRATSKPIEIYGGWLRYYTFIPGPGCHIVRSFISPDGLKWDLEAENRLGAKGKEDMFDVSVVKWRGGYKMFFKTEAPD